MNTTGGSRSSGTGRVAGCLKDPNGAPLRLETTRGLDATVRFPELAGLPAALAPHAAVVDGELVAFDERGRPSFRRIQDRIHVSDARAAARRAAENSVSYLVFDLLHLGGHDLTGLAYVDRRKLLADVVPTRTNWRVPGHYVGGGTELLEAARANGLKGVMAKRLDSRYLPGEALALLAHYVHTPGRCHRRRRRAGIRVAVLSG